MAFCSLADKVQLIGKPRSVPEEVGMQRVKEEKGEAGGL